jgi:hypothetical protein
VIGLVLLALVGLLLAALDWSHLAVSGAHIRTALGESFIVAAALGLTVDVFYKRELAAKWRRRRHAQDSEPAGVAPAQPPAG